MVFGGDLPRLPWHWKIRTQLQETDVFALTLFPTATVRMWDPSSLDTQSNMTLCLGDTEEGEFPILLMYFFTPSKVDKLGTETKPGSRC